jgi:hypothetical protein
MSESYENEIRKEAKDEVKMEEDLAYSRKMMDMYKNPIFRFALTIMEVLPVGLVITLLSALLLKRKDFLPPTERA